MKTSITKIQLPLLFLCGMLLAVSACRKENSDRSGSALKEEPAVNAMKEKIKKEGTGITSVYPINELIPLQLINSSGEFTTQAAIKSAKLNATYLCDYPGGLVDVNALLESISRDFECGNGYKFSVTYQISAPFHIVASNPYVPTIVSKALIRIKSTPFGDGSSVVYTEDNIPAVITPLGDDPGNTNNFLFRVTFTTSYVPSPIVHDNARYIEPLVTIATDCDLYPALGSELDRRSHEISERSRFPDAEPCGRTDKCFINPSMSGIFGSIAGSNVFGACTVPGLVLSEAHDFEYREITGFSAPNWATTGTPGQWTVVPVPSVSGSGTTNGTIGYWEVRTLPSATFISNHVYEFRYRNRMVTGIRAPCQGAWSVPERYMFY